MSDEPIFKHLLREPLTPEKGETVTELKFRKPRAGDIVRCGNPVKYMPFAESQDISFDEQKMNKMLAALSGLYPPVIEKMDPQDWMECAWGIARFFVPWLSREPSTTA